VTVVAPPVPGGWHRLHPLSPVIKASRALAGLAVIFAFSLVNSVRNGQGGFYGHAIAATVVITLGVVSWLVTRWRVQDGVLRIETGLIRRQSLRFPLSQIQAIDTVRPGLARIFGLAELRLRMGGSTGSHGRLAYLTAVEADKLRGELLALAAGPAGAGAATQAAEGGETVLASVPTGRLIGSIVLSRPALITLIVLIVISVITFSAGPAVALVVLGSSGAAGLGLITIIWRRFNSGYRLTVAEAPDGLRVRSGLVETSAETIPRGRVQAVRMVEPWLWRPLGWCRVEVDVAGRQHRSGENASEGHQLRAVLPVGSHAEADLLLGRILPDAPTQREPPPPRARAKSPLRYPHLAWGRTDTCAVTTTGWPGRVTSWVPFQKVQSIRLVQGPIQRRLRLATIHLDTAGRSLHASLTDRDEDEANRLLVELVEKSRAARRLIEPRRQSIADSPPILAAPGGL
jgi:putative membrane protein